MELAKEIDLDLYSNKISDISRGKQRFIRTLAENSIIREIAEELSAARPVIALALLAKLVEEDNRGAKRFAQRIWNCNLNKYFGIICSFAHFNSCNFQFY